MSKAFKIIISVLPFLIVFVASIYTSSDPDLGWHLKYGEHFFKTGEILRENTFSTEMSDFRWANVSWGTDIITYAVFALSGFFGLTLLSAAVVTFTFYFFSKAARLTVWDQSLIFPLLLHLEEPINNVSFRGQQISLMMLGILFYILSLYEDHPKILYFIPPLSLVWVNLHGQFVLGLAVFAVFVFGKVFLSMLQKDLFKKKHEIIKLLGIFTLSVISTLINPFGTGIHMDAIEHIGNPLLKSVGEYLPFVFMSSLWWNQLIVAMIITGGFIYLYFKKQLYNKLPFLLSGVLLYVLSFSVRRFAWPAYYMILTFLKPVAGFLKPDKKKSVAVASLSIMIITLIIIVSGKLPFSQYIDYSWNEYCKKPVVACSPESAEFLKNSNLKGDLYSLYGWGGYLIWNYPQVKPSIDGRMHVWRDESGYSAFEEYYSYEQNIKDIDDSKYDIVYMSPTKPVYKRMGELVEKGSWEMIYQDDYAGVFVRK